MKDKNFSSLKNITTPESWIENAKAIPNAPVKAEKKVFFTLPKILTAAACILLVCAVSVPLYVFTQNGASIAVVPTDATTEVSFTTSTQCTTSKKTEPTLKTDASTETKAEESTSQAMTLETEPEEKPIRPGGVEWKPQGSKPPVPVVPPTASTEPKETFPIPETEPSHDIPVEPDTPDWTAVEETTGSGDSPVTSGVTCNGSFYPDFMFPDSSDNVGEYLNLPQYYCRMYDSNGKLIGDSNMYSSQHKVTSAYYYNGRIYTYYNPESAGISLKNGNYYFEIYNSRGTVLYNGYTG